MTNMAARQYLVGKYEEYYNSLKGDGAAASKANEYATEVNNLLNEFSNVQNLMNYWEGEAKDAMSETSLTSIMEKFKTAQSNVQEALEPCCQAIDTLVGVLEEMKTTEDEWLAKQDELEAKKKSEPTITKNDSASQQRHNSWQNEVNELQTKIDELKKKLDEIKAKADTNIDKIETLESQIEEFTNYMNMTGTIMGADASSDFSKYSLEERLQYLQELIDNYEKIYEGLNTLFMQKYSTGFKFTQSDFEKIDFLFDAFDIYWISKVDRNSLVKSEEYGTVMLDIEKLTTIISFCTENDVFGKIDKYMNGASWKDSGLESLYGGFWDTGSANFLNFNGYNEDRFLARLRDKYGVTGDAREYLKEHIGELTTSYKKLMDEYGEYEKLMGAMSECQQYIDGFKQAKKLMPFEINMENSDFQSYLSKDFSGYSLLSQEQLQVMSQKEVALYDYLYHTKSKQEAEAYLKAMEQTMNQRIGAYRAAEYIEYLKQGGYGIDDLLKSGWEGTKDGVRNFFDGLADVLRVSSTNKGDKSALDYEMMYKAQFMQELMKDSSYVDPNVDKATLGFGNVANWYNTGTSVGNMLIPSVVSFIPVVGKPLSTTLMTLSITGNTAVEAKQQGYSTAQAYLYGALSGASETFTEVMMGGIPGISNLEGKGLFSSMLSEGLEEFTQEYLDVGLRWATLGEKPEFTAAAAHERFANATQAGIQGMLTSGVMQGGNSALGIGINAATKALSPTVTTADGSTVKKFNSYMEFKNSIESDFYTPRAASAIDSALSKMQNGETVSFAERVKLNRAIQNVSTEELAGITHNLTAEQTQSLTDATRGIPKLSANSASKITDARTLSRAMDSTTTLNGVESMTSEQLNSEVTRNGETMADYIVNRKAASIDTTTIEKIRQIDPATADNMASRASEIRRAASVVQQSQPSQTPAQTTPRTGQTQAPVETQRASQTQVQPRADTSVAPVETQPTVQTPVQTQTQVQPAVQAPVQTQTQVQPRVETRTETAQTTRQTPVQTRTETTSVQPRTETTQVQTEAVEQAQQAAAEQVLNNIIQQTAQAVPVVPGVQAPIETQTRTAEALSQPAQMTTEATQTTTQSTGTAEKVAIAGASATSLLAVAASGLSMMSPAASAVASNSAQSSYSSASPVESSVANPSINASATQGINEQTTTTTSSSSGEGIAVSNNLTETAIDHGLITSVDTGASVPTSVNAAALGTTSETVSAPAPASEAWTYTLERNTNVGKRGETIEVKMDLIDRSLTPDGNLRAARKAWNAAGRPTSGEIFDRYQSAFAYSKLAGGTNTRAINALHQQEGNINYESSAFRSDATTEQGTSRTDFIDYTKGRATAEEINTRRGQTTTTTEAQTTIPIESQTTTETETVTPIETQPAIETETVTPVETTTEVNTELISQVESEIGSLSVEEVSEMVSSNFYDDIKEIAQEMLKSDSDQKQKLLTAFAPEAIKHGDVEIIDAIKASLTTEERTQLVESIRALDPAMATAFETINAENASTFVQTQAETMTETSFVEEIMKRDRTIISIDEEGQIVDEFGDPIESSVIQKHIENIQSLDPESATRYLDEMGHNKALLTNPPSNGLLYADVNYQTITSTFGNTVTKMEDGSYSIGTTTIQQENMSRFVEIVESLESERATVAMEMVSANPEILNSSNIGLFEDSHFETLNDNIGKAMFSEQFAKTLSTTSVEETIELFNNENMKPLLENGRISTLLENGVDVLNEQFVSDFTAHEMTLLGEMVDNFNGVNSDYSRYRIGEIINAQNNSLLHDALRFSEIVASDTNNKSIYTGVKFTAEDVSRSRIYEVASVKDSAKKVMLMTEILGEEHLSVRVTSKGENALSIDGVEEVHDFITYRTAPYSFIQKNPSLFNDEFRAKYSALQAIDNAIKNFDGTNATQIIENAKSINYLDTARNMTQEIYDAVTADYTNGLRTSYENLDAPSRVVDGVTVLDVTDQDYSLLVHTIGGNEGVGVNAQISTELLSDLSKWSTTTGGNPNLSTSLITNTDQIIYGKPKIILGFANIEGHSLLGERATDAGSSRDTLINPSTTVFDSTHTASMEGLKKARAEYLARVRESGNPPAWSEVILSRADANGKVLSPDYLVCFGEVDQFTIDAAKTLGVDGKPLPILVLNSTNPNATAISTDVSTMTADKIIMNYETLTQNGADLTQITPEVRRQILSNSQAPASLVLDLVSTTNGDTRVINIDGTTSSSIISKVKQAVSANPDGHYVIEVTDTSRLQAFTRINSKNVVMSYETSSGTRTMTLSEYSSLRNAVISAQNINGITPTEAINSLTTLSSEQSNVPAFMSRDVTNATNAVRSYVEQHSFTAQELTSLNNTQLNTALTVNNNNSTVRTVTELFNSNPEFRSQMIETYINGEISNIFSYKNMMSSNLTGNEIVQNYSKLKPMLYMTAEVKSRILGATNITNEIIRDTITGRGNILMLLPEYANNADVIDRFIRQNSSERFTTIVDQNSIEVLSKITAPIGCYAVVGDTLVQVSQREVLSIADTYVSAKASIITDHYEYLIEAIDDYVKISEHANTQLGIALGLEDMATIMKENIIEKAINELNSLSRGELSYLIQIDALQDTSFKNAITNALINETGDSLTVSMYNAIRNNPNAVIPIDVQKGLASNLNAKGIINIYDSIREGVLDSKFSCQILLNAPNSFNVPSNVINDILTRNGQVIDPSIIHGENAIKRVTDFINMNPDRTFTFEMGSNSRYFVSMKNVAYQYTENGVTKIATGAEVIAASRPYINFLSKYGNVNPDSLYSSDVADLIIDYTALANNSRPINAMYMESAADTFISKIKEIDFSKKVYSTIETVLDGPDIMKLLQTVSKIDTITGINGIVSTMINNNPTININVKEALFKRGAVFSDVITSTAIRDTPANVLIANYSKMSDATRRAIANDPIAVQSIVNNKDIAPSMKMLQDLLVENNFLKSNIDLDAIGAARVAQMLNGRGNLYIALSSSPDNIRLIELLNNESLHFTTSGYNGAVGSYTPSGMRELVNSLRPVQDSPLTISSIKSSIDKIYSTFYENFEGLTEDALKRLTNPYSNIQLNESHVISLGADTVEKMISLGIQKDRIISMALNSNNPGMTPIRRAILSGNMHTLSETAIINDVAHDSNLLSDTIAGVPANTLVYTTAINPSALTPQAIANINEFAKSNPGHRIVLDFANTRGISSETISNLHENVMVKIEGGYSTEYFTKRFYRNMYVDSEFASNIYTRNEAYAITKTMERIESKIDPNWSETEKAIFIYETLKRNITYDHRLCDYEIDLHDNKKIQKPGDYVSDSTRSLRGLVSGESVCAGYAVIYQELLARQGIEAYYEYGDVPATYDDPSSGGHAWNLVVLDGKKYICDLTWDRNSNFGMGNNQFVKDFNKFSYSHVTDARTVTPGYYYGDISTMPRSTLVSIAEQVRATSARSDSYSSALDALSRNGTSIRTDSSVLTTTEKYRGITSKTTNSSGSSTVTNNSGIRLTNAADPRSVISPQIASVVNTTLTTPTPEVIRSFSATVRNNPVVGSYFADVIATNPDVARRFFSNRNAGEVLSSLGTGQAIRVINAAPSVRTIDTNVIKNILNYEGNIPYRVMETILTDELGRFTIPSGIAPKAMSRIRNYVETSGREFSMDIDSNEALNSWHILDSERVKGVFLDPEKGDTIIRASEFDAAITKYKGVFGKYTLSASKGQGTTNLKGLLNDFINVRKLGTSDVDNFIMRKIRTDMGAVLRNTVISTSDFTHMNLGEIYSTLYLSQYNGLSVSSERNLTISMEINPKLRDRVFEAITRGNFAASEGVERALNSGLSVEALIQNHTILNQRGSFSSPEVAEKILNYEGFVPNEIINEAMAYKGKVNLDVRLSNLGMSRVQQFLATTNGQYTVELSGVNSEAYKNFLAVNSTRLVGTYTTSDGMTYPITSTELRRVISEINAIGDSRNVIAAANRLYEIKETYRFLGNDVFARTVDKLNRVPIPLEQVQNMHPLTAKALFGLGIQKDAIMSYALNNNNRLVGTVLSPTVWSIDENRLMLLLGEELTKGTVVGGDAANISYTTRINPAILNDGAINTINEYARSHPDMRLALDFESTRGLTSDMIAKLDKNILIKVEGAYSTEFLLGTSNTLGAKAGNFTSNVFSQAEAYAIVKRFERIESRIDPRWTNMEKAVYTYDVLAQSISYDEANLELEKERGRQIVSLGVEGDRTDNASHIIRSLRGVISGKSVCAGYAVIYQEALTRLGIPAYYECGMGGSGHHGTGGHAWNIVTIDGKNYRCDLTWDAGGSLSNPNTENKFIQSTADYDAEHHRGVKSSVVPSRIYTEGFTSLTPQEVHAIDSKVTSVVRQKSGLFNALESLMRKNPSVKSDMEFSPPTPNPKTRKAATGPSEVIFDNVSRSEVNSLLDTTSELSPQDVTRIIGDVINGNIEGVTDVETERVNIINQLLETGAIDRVSGGDFYNLLSIPETKDTLLLSDRGVSFYQKNVYKYNSASRIAFALFENSPKFFNKLSSSDLKQTINRYNNWYTFPTLRDEVIRRGLAGDTEIKFDYKKALNQKIKEYSGVETIDSFNAEGKYLLLDYTTTSGETKTLQVKCYNSAVQMINGIDGLYEALNNNEVTSISIRENDIKNQLLFNSLEKDIVREYSLVVDGVEQTVITAEIDLNSKFPNAHDVKVNGIKEIGNYNLYVANSNTPAKLSYDLNGVHYEKYIMPTLFYDGNRVGANYYITSHNLVGIENVKITELSPQQFSMERLTSYSIENNESMRDVLTDDMYGGHQGDVNTLFKSEYEGKTLTPLQQKQVDLLHELSKRYFPNATPVEEVNLSVAYTNSGCYYMALANAFGSYMSTVPNGEEVFRSKFGFDLYTESENGKVMNLQAMVYDMYLDYASRIFDGNATEAVEKEFDAGVADYTYKSIVIDYYNRHGIEINIDYNNDTVSCFDSSVEGLRNIATTEIMNNEGAYFILTSRHFDMEQITDHTRLSTQIEDGALKDATTIGKVRQDVGGHAMLITEVDSDGNIYVSSWGNKHKIITSSITERAHNSDVPSFSVTPITFKVVDGPININSNSIGSAVTTEVAAASPMNSVVFNALDEHAVPIDQHLSNLLDSKSLNEAVMDEILNSPDTAPQTFRNYLSFDKANKVELVKSLFGFGRDYGIDVTEYLSPSQMATVISDTYAKYYGNIPDYVARPLYNVMETVAENKAYLAKVLETPMPKDVVRDLLEESMEYEEVEDIPGITDRVIIDIGDASYEVMDYVASLFRDETTIYEFVTSNGIVTQDMINQNITRRYKQYTEMKEFYSKYAPVAEKWKRAMNSDEIGNFYAYTGQNDFAVGCYKTINGILRGIAYSKDFSTIKVVDNLGGVTTYTNAEWIEKAKMPIKEFVAKTIDHAIQMNNSMSGFRLTEDTTLYRGIGFNALAQYGITKNDSPEVILEKLIKNSGSIYTDNGFMSSSVIPGPITENAEICLELNCVAGTQCGDMCTTGFSSYTNENEILLKAGSKFIIQKVYQKDGKTFIQLTNDFSKLRK